MIIPRPQFNEVDPESPEGLTLAEYTRVTKFIDCTPWQCSVCKAQNFGRNQFCAYCKGRLRQSTPRPTSHRE